ncbi:hypothetical protein [Pelosinus sp. IPA-1]|nr:hypothetical protein [Pelosinus sp. IPA-1]GMA98151.1 hypothetical protein PIPA1_09510 [Pelosinus sp. IPA-1]
MVHRKAIWDTVFKNFCSALLPDTEAMYRKATSSACGIVQLKMGTIYLNL